MNPRTTFTLARRAAGRGRWAAVVLVAGLLGLQALFGTPAVAQPAISDCAEAPPLERPGDGAVGSIDPPQGNGAKDSLYLNYGYAGFTWNTYDQHTGPICGDAFASATTWVGNRIFDVAKLLVGTTNSLHYAMKNGGLVTGFDDIVRKGSAALYSGAAVPYLAFALMLVAVALLWYALRGDLAATSKGTARVLAGLWIMAATALTPLAYTAITDSVLVTGVDELEANLYSQLNGNQDTVYRDVLPTMLHQKVVVENWARGEFGNYETDYAKQTTPRLVDAQAWNWNDVRTGRDANNDAEKAKHDAYKKIAEEIKQGRANYAAFSGDGASRIGASVFALIQAFCMVAFQLLCKVAILLAQLVLRLAILAGPVIGLLVFAPGIGRTLARTIAGILVQGVVLAAAAATHGLVMVWISESTAFGGRFMNMVMMAVVTVILWVVLKPWRRLKNMAAAAGGVPALSRDTLRLEQLLQRQARRASGSGLWNRVKRFGRAVDKAGGRSVSVPDGYEPRRPEAQPAVWNDAEVMRDGPGRVVAHRGETVRGGSRRPRSVWADAEVMRDRGSHGSRREPYTGGDARRPELVPAQAALPAGRGNPGDGADDSGAGRGGPGGDPGGYGAGGGGARAESIDSHGYEPPQVVDGEVDGESYVIPSRIAEHDQGDEGATPGPARPESTDNDGGV